MHETKFGKFSREVKRQNGSYSEAT